MPRNRVQHQKGLSDDAFERLYPDEGACRRAWFAWRWPEGFKCPRCAASEYCEIRDRQLLQCPRCRYQTSLIAGTVLQGTKLPMRVWLRAMQQGIVHERHVTGSDRRAARHPAFRWANTMLANIKNSLLATHRVSPPNIYRATSAPSLGGSTDALSSKQSTSASPSRRRQRRRCPTSSSNWLRLDGKQELYYHVEDHSPGQAR